MKELEKYTPETTRDQLESDLSLLGLLLFRNEMKTDSPYALAQLRDGGVRCVMCTGDNAVTGVAIAKRCNMLSSETSKIIMGDIDKDEQIQWQSYTDGASMKHQDVLCSDAHEVDIVLTKPAFRCLIHSDEMDSILNKVRVYARMKPDDKVAVIKLHQDRGLVVGMVGDGGNDCGALRTAHVGLALSDAEVSIVAPFSSGATYGTGEKSLMAVPHLFRYGRATLQTNSGTFLFFMIYGFALPTSKLTQTLMSSAMMAEWDWLFIDVILAVLFVSLMTKCR